MSSLSHMWKLHATAKMKEFWNCQVTTAKRVDLANAHQALQGQPSSHSRHAWFPSLQCAGRLPGTGLGTWDAANLPQCPSAQFSIPQTALWHASTFLPHGAYCTVPASSCNYAWHLPSPLQSLVNWLSTFTSLELSTRPHTLQVHSYDIPLSSCQPNCYT